MQHTDLCDLAKKWLLRPANRDGHGCSIAFSECRSGWAEEMPDAIGFRAVESLPVSVIVEVKMSRSDFFADRKKTHRASGLGLGQYRYYLAPKGLILPADLPDGWGLIESSPKGLLTQRAGLFFDRKESGGKLASAADAHRWEHPSDKHREIWLLTKMLARTHDPDATKKILNKSFRERIHLAKKCDDQAREIRALQAKLAGRTMGGHY